MKTKKKNFWLYYGNKLITGVRMASNSTAAQVIMHALHTHDIMPCGSSLYPDYCPSTIRGMIANSEVRE